MNLGLTNMNFKDDENKVQRESKFWAQMFEGLWLRKSWHFYKGTTRKYLWT